MSIRKLRIKLILSGFLILWSIVNGVVITIYNVDKSSNIGGISQEIKNLKLGNNAMVEEISSKDSLSDFSEKSGKMGFSDKVNIMYFGQTEPVAQIR